MRLTQEHINNLSEQHRKQLNEFEHWHSDDASTSEDSHTLRVNNDYDILCEFHYSPFENKFDTHTVMITDAFNGLDVPYSEIENFNELKTALEQA